MIDLIFSVEVVNHFKVYYWLRFQRDLGGVCYCILGLRWKCTYLRLAISNFVNKNPLPYIQRYCTMKYINTPQVFDITFLWKQREYFLFIYN